MRYVHRIGRFYTKIIMENIGIFIFIGMLSVLFHDDGWFPNRGLYVVGVFAYSFVLPCVIAYAAGKAMEPGFGGVVAVAALCGLLAADVRAGLFGAMLSGPVAGYLWRKEKEFLDRTCEGIEMQMLVRNLCIGMTGCVLAAGEYYLLSEALRKILQVIYQGVDFLIVHNGIGFLNIIIEPAKVFFMNNLVNHGILIPIGMSQVREAGQSCLFLMEANPGPGFGMLMALYLTKKRKREECVSAAVAEALGGIHEVYFPFVLAKLKLLIPLILGGMAGTFCFDYLQCGLKGAVSPGSILTILFFAGKSSVLPVLVGITVSAAVSFGGCILLLKAEDISKEAGTYQLEDMEKSRTGDATVSETVNETKSRAEAKTGEAAEMETQETVYRKIYHIGFVCDGGMGSSAMGAAIFRRVLMQHGITDRKVAAYAADMIPEDVELIVCQEDFYRFSETLHDRECYRVTSFVKTEEYLDLAAKIENNML